MRKRLRSRPRWRDERHTRLACSARRPWNFKSAQAKAHMRPNEMLPTFWHSAEVSRYESVMRLSEASVAPDRAKNKTMLVPKQASQKLRTTSSRRVANPKFEMMCERRAFSRTVADRGMPLRFDPRHRRS